MPAEKPTVEVQAKRCTRCGELKSIHEFYERRDGKRDPACIQCESMRRKVKPSSNIERRKAEIREGRRPRISEHQKRRVLAVFRNTNNKAHAARVAGVSRNTVDRILEEFKDHIQENALPPEPIAYDKLSERGRRGVDEFPFFDSEFLGYETEPWEEELARELLDAYYSEEDEYLVVNVAPGAGKSTLVTFRFVAWVTVRERAMGREPRIQLGHRAEGKAKWYVKRLRLLFTRNFDLIEEFGRFKPESNIGGAPWSEIELMVEPLDWSAIRQKEPTISAASYEGSILSGRYSLIIWDDLVDKSNSRTKDARENLVDVVDNEAESRLDSPGLFVLCGARQGPEDLFNNRLRLEDIEEVEDGRPKKLYRRIIFKAHYEELCDGTSHRAPYPEGCLLTKRIPYFKVRHQMSKNMQRFRLVWQQEDVDPVGTLADIAWFRGGTDHRGWMAPGCFDSSLMFGRLPQRNDRPILSAVTVDPSASNFWAVQHFLYYENGDRVIHRGLRQRMNAPDLIYREADGRYTGVLEDWWQSSQAIGVQFRYVITEVRSQQKWLNQYEFVTTWAQSRGVVLVPHDTHLNKSDPDRGIENDGPVYREGRLRIPYAGHEEKLFADAFAREATSWPEGQTWDLLMGHWFFEYHLLHLLALEEIPEDVDSSAPAWAQEVRPPAWASERLAGRVMAGVG